MKLLACMNLGLKRCFHTSSTTANRDLLLHTVLHPHLFQPDDRWPAWTVNSDLHLYVISSACLASISVSPPDFCDTRFQPVTAPYTNNAVKPWPCSTHFLLPRQTFHYVLSIFHVFWPLLLPAACKAHKLHGFCILYCFLAFACSFASWFVFWTFILRSVRSSTFESASCSSWVYFSSVLSSVVPYTHLTHILYLYPLSPDLVHLPSPNAAVPPAHVSMFLHKPILSPLWPFSTNDAYCRSCRSSLWFSVSLLTRFASIQIKQLVFSLF